MCIQKIVEVIIIINTPLYSNVSVLTKNWALIQLSSKSIQNLSAIYSFFLPTSHINKQNWYLHCTIRCRIFFFVNNINETDKFCSLMHANFYRHSFSFWGLYVQILQYNYILWWCISTFRIVYITSISYCTLVFDFLFLFIQVSMSN